MKNSRPSRSFASDNNAGVHPQIMEAIAAANDGHVIAYGDDPTLLGPSSSFAGNSAMKQKSFCFRWHRRQRVGLKSSHRVASCDHLRSDRAHKR